jgi:hypothetical protein
MSFTERKAGSAPAEPFAQASPRRSERQTERRKRRRHLVARRQDVAIGVLVALAALIIGPGLAVIAIIALLVLLVCGISLGVGRTRGRRSGRRRSRRVGPPR